MGLPSEQNNLQLAQKLMLYSAVENGASLLELAIGMPLPPAREFNALEPYNPKTDDQQIGTPAYCFRDIIFATPRSITYQPLVNVTSLLKLPAGMP